MLYIKEFTFNPFQENTYILYNDQGECIIIDPGCYEPYEQEELSGFIKEKGLTPKMLLNTHAHIDHVLGNAFVYKAYNLSPQLHEKEINVLNAIPGYAHNYGITYDVSPAPSHLLNDGDIIRFGEDSLEIIFTPGHSPGSVSFYCEKQRFIISGDVLFYRSIGRTDLTGGDYGTLIRSIKNRLMILPEETIVHSGHGPQTTIGSEKLYNPFINQ